MKKRRIVIASVLKPVDDTRMYEKMAQGLMQSGDYELTVIGQASIDIPAHAGIAFIPLKTVRRISLDRLLLPMKIAAKLFKVKPELLIINTHELLIVSILNRILFGCKIVYDIRENHYRNIRFSDSFPYWMRTLLALWVRFKEKFTSPLIHHFVLAEKAYQNELTFIGNRYSIFENKAAVLSDPKPGSRHALNLLFSGTIAKSTGVFEAIVLAKSLHQLNPNVRLTIAGYCALESTRAEVKKQAASRTFIRLIGVDHLVPHRQIIQEINNAGFGIIYYPPLPHTLGSVPTKLYEYLASRLPILTWDDQTFSDLVLSNRAGLLVTEPYNELLGNMQSIQFYPQPVNDVYWEGEKFAGLISQLVK